MSLKPQRVTDSEFERIVQQLANPVIHSVNGTKRVIVGRREFWCPLATRGLDGAA